MTLPATRVTHSCVLLEFGGQRLVTDPWFSERRGYTGQDSQAWGVVHRQRHSESAAAPASQTVMT